MTLSFGSLLGHGDLSVVPDFSFSVLLFVLPVLDDHVQPELQSDCCGNLKKPPIQHSTVWYRLFPLGFRKYATLHTFFIGYRRHETWRSQGSADSCLFRVTLTYSLAPNWPRIRCPRLFLGTLHLNGSLSHPVSHSRRTAS